MALTVVQLTCAGQSTAASTTNAVAVTNNPTVGNYLILIARWGTSGNTLSSVSDTVNTWTVDKAGNQVAFASCKVVGSMSGKSITTTFSGSDSNKGMYVFEVSPGAGNTLSFVSAVTGAVFFNGTNRNCQSNTITPQVGDLMLAGWADSSAETSLTAGSGLTDLPAATGAGYFSTASIFIEGVYKVAAATTATSLTGTGGASPTAYSYILGSYRPVSSGSTDTFAFATTGTSAASMGLAGMTDAFSVAATGKSAVVFTPAGMTDTFSFATKGVSTPVFATVGTDRFSFATTGTSAVALSLAGMTDAISVASTGRSTPVFTLAGMTDTIAVTVAGKSTPVFAMAGAARSFAVAATSKSTVAFQTSGTDKVVFAASSVSAPSFTLAGMTDTFSFATSGVSAVSFNVTSTGGTPHTLFYDQTAQTHQVVTRH